MRLLRANRRPGPGPSGPILPFLPAQIEGAETRFEEPITVARLRPKDPYAEWLASHEHERAEEQIRWVYRPRGRAEHESPARAPTSRPRAGVA
jgi:hypothetical protein